MHTPPDPADHLGAALGLLYDAATSPELWPAALDAFGPLFASSAAHLFLWDRAEDRATLSLTSRNYRGEDQFHRRYGDSDARRHLPMRRPPGFLPLCQEHFDQRFVDQRFVDHSELDNDVSPPLDRRWLMATSLWDEAGTAAIFAVFRPPAAAPYSAADRALLSRLLPDLRRAFRLDQQLRAARAQAALGRSVVDALPQAVLATDAVGRIRHANRAAEALLVAGAALRQDQGRLVAATPAETALLHAVLRRAAEAAPGSDPGPAPSLILHDRSGAGLAVTVIPLDPDAGLSEMPGQRLALVTTTPMQAPRPAPAALRTAFGFTGAEAELAIALAGGRRLDVAA
jgi:PAS domain-containing protein